MVKKISITVLILLIISFFIINKKEKTTITSKPTATATTSKSSSSFNCYTTTADAASIQLINPLSPKSWFNLSFCFTPPTQNIPNPIVYTNADTMNVTLQIFTNRVYLGNKGWTTEKIDEYFYQQAIGAPYPVTKVTFPQKPALENGTFTFPINLKFVKKGYYNPFINSYQYLNDTVNYNYDAYDFGMHSATTNSYAYVRLVIKSDKK